MSLKLCLLTNEEEELLCVCARTWVKNFLSPCVCANQQDSASGFQDPWTKMHFWRQAPDDSQKGLLIPKQCLFSGNTCGVFKDWPWPRGREASHVNWKLKEWREVCFQRYPLPVIPVPFKFCGVSLIVDEYGSTCFRCNILRRKKQLLTFKSWLVGFSV